MSQCNLFRLVRSGFLVIFFVGLGIACGPVEGGQAGKESAPNGGAGESPTRERGCDEGP